MDETKLKKQVEDSEEGSRVPKGRTNPGIKDRVIGKLGSIFTLDRVYRFVIPPTLFTIAVILFFTLKRKKGG